MTATNLSLGEVYEIGNQIAKEYGCKVRTDTYNHGLFEVILANVEMGQAAPLINYSRRNNFRWHREIYYNLFYDPDTLACVIRTACRDLQLQRMTAMLSQDD